MTNDKKHAPGHDHERRILFGKLVHFIRWPRANPRGLPSKHDAWFKGSPLSLRNNVLVIHRTPFRKTQTGLFALYQECKCVSTNDP